MTKTITLRLDKKLYDLFKSAAAGDRRSISNYIEYATLNYILDKEFVDEDEMNWVMSRKKELKRGWKDIEQGRYRVIG